MTSMRILLVVILAVTDGLLLWALHLMSPRRTEGGDQR